MLIYTEDRKKERHPFLENFSQPCQKLPLFAAKRLFLAAFICLLLLGPATWNWSDLAYAADPAESSSGATLALDFYQSFLSRADGQRCPMAPSCSQYAKQAFHKYGFIKGWVLTCDRLLRCGRDEIRLAPAIRVNGVIQAFDPLEANTFWWDRH
jgi:hypothetical protein